MKAQATTRFDSNDKLFGTCIVPNYLLQLPASNQGASVLACHVCQDFGLHRRLVMSLVSVDHSHNRPSFVGLRDTTLILAFDWLMLHR